jgi:hypothetical protein
MTMETTIALAANVAIALSFLVAVIFGIAQVRIAGRDRRERLTLDMIRNFQTREFAEILYYFQASTAPTTREEFQAMPPNEQIIFIQLSQQMEALGILVAERYIDLDLVDKTLGSFVTTGWERYKSIILDLRAKVPDPFLSEYFQWLAEQIDDSMTNHPRLPFYEQKEIHSSFRRKYK